MKEMTAQQIAERLRQAAHLIEDKNIDAEHLVCATVDGWGEIAIHVEVEALLAMFPAAQFEGRHGRVYVDPDTRFVACISQSAASLST